MFLNILHNIIYIITKYKILYNIKHHIRQFIYMDFSSLLTLVETNFTKVLNDLFKKLYPPLCLRENKTIIEKSWQNKLHDQNIPP